MSRLVVALSFCSVFGCTYARTQTTLIIDADDMIRQSASEYWIEVLNGDGAQVLLHTHRPTSPSFVPLRIPVTARRGDDTRTFQVTVRACRSSCMTDSAPLAETRARGGFSRGRVMELPLWLLSGCPVCRANTTCSRGENGQPACVPIDQVPVLDAAVDTSASFDATVHTRDVQVEEPSCGPGFASCTEFPELCCATSASPWTVVRSRQLDVDYMKMLVGADNAPVLVSDEGLFMPPAVMPQRYGTAMGTPLLFDAVYSDGTLLLLSGGQLFSRSGGVWSVEHTFPAGPSLTYVGLAASGVSRFVATHYDDQTNWNLTFHARQQGAALYSSTMLASDPNGVGGGRHPVVAVDRDGAAHVFVGNLEFVPPSQRFELPGRLNARTDHSFGRLSDGRLVLRLGSVFYAGSSGQWELLGRCGEDNFSVDRFGVIHSLGRRDVTSDAGRKDVPVYFRFDPASGACTHEVIDPSGTHLPRTYSINNLAIAVGGDGRTHVAWTTFRNEDGGYTREFSMASRASQ